MLSSLEALEEKAAKLRTLVKQERELAESSARTRDELNAKFRVLISEYRNLRGQRDDAIARAKALRDQKEAVYQRLQELHKKLSEKDAEISAVRSIDRQVQRAKEALERAEWEYQTRSMSPVATKSLEKEIAELEQKLSIAMRKQEAYKETFELKQNYDLALHEFRSLRDEFRKTASRLDELRAGAAAKLGEAKKVKTEADNQHQNYISHANEVIKIQAELNALRMQLQETRRDTRQRVHYEERDRTNRIISEKVAKAKEKFNKGEKLNFEEWQALLLGDELARR